MGPWVTEVHAHGVIANDELRRCRCVGKIRGHKPGAYSCRWLAVSVNDKNAVVCEANGLKRFTDVAEIDPLAERSVFVVGYGQRAAAAHAGGAQEGGNFAVC